MNDQAKYRIVLASHGTLSEGILDSVQLLLGEQQNIAAYCLDPKQNMEKFAEILKNEIYDHGSDNVLFMTDLMNGTPFNAVVSLVRYYPTVYHITGMNLATVIGAVTARNAGAAMEEICEAAMNAAEGSILDVKKLLGGFDLDGEE